MEGLTNACQMLAFSSNQCENKAHEDLDHMHVCEDVALTRHATLFVDIFHVQQVQRLHVMQVQTHNIDVFY